MSDRVVVGCALADLTSSTILTAQTSAMSPLRSHDRQLAHAILHIQVPQHHKREPARIDRHQPDCLRTITTHQVTSAHILPLLRYRLCQEPNAPISAILRNSHHLPRSGFGHCSDILNTPFMMSVGLCPSLITSFGSSSSSKTTKIHHKSHKGHKTRYHKRLRQTHRARTIPPFSIYDLRALLRRSQAQQEAQLSFTYTIVLFSSRSELAT